MSNRKKLRGSIGMRAIGDSIQQGLQEGLASLKYNGYLCETCGKGFLTLDLHEGVAPMFSPCFATEGCEGKAVSMGYPNGEPPAELGEPIIYWYKPTPEEFRTLGTDLQYHVKRGGLLRKASEHAPDWVKAIA